MPCLPTCPLCSDLATTAVTRHRLRRSRERGIHYVTYGDWQILDQYEVAAGRTQGRPRVKVTTVPEMMEVIRAGR